jgi:hypothetical protein
MREGVAAAAKNEDITLKTAPILTKVKICKFVNQYSVIEKKLR